MGIAVAVIVVPCWIVLAILGGVLGNYTYNYTDNRRIGGLWRIFIALFGTVATAAANFRGVKAVFGSGAPDSWIHAIVFVLLFPFVVGLVFVIFAVSARWIGARIGSTGENAAGCLAAGAFDAVPLLPVLFILSPLL
jgi:hypothetical protein